MPPSEISRIKARIQAVKDVKKLVEELPIPKDSRLAKAYKERAARAVAELLCPSEQEPPKHRPIKKVEREALRFGEFADVPLRDVPLQRMDWYLQRAIETAELLTEYLRHPDLKNNRDLQEYEQWVDVTS